jgi:ribonuclease BN (tRNA processing enzyme)
MKKQLVFAIIVCLLFLLPVAWAGDSEVVASQMVPDTPDTSSGLRHTLSQEGYSQFDYDTVDPEKLKQQGGKIYSTPQEIMTVLAAGVNNPTGTKELWKEGLMFQGVAPMDHMKSAANWFPGTEKVQPNEMRVTFMGTSPLLRPGQMNTSIYVELGNGANFVFDMGEGAIANYLAAGIAFNQLTEIFITHLHIDHFASIPYLYEFGGWVGRWEKPLSIYGPSGASEEYGTRAMVDGMLKMINWHDDSFDMFPAGNKLRVVEFDFEDDGGIIYDKDGVTVRHWRRSHCKDGASGYRLDWKQPDGEELSFVWTGDGRPSMLDLEHAKGADLYITEVQTELVGLMAQVYGVPPFLARYTLDTSHTPGYAAGWLANEIKPRLFMTTHMPYDAYLNAETVAQVRQHWKGPFHFGAPDGIVVNVNPEKVWVREGILPDFPNNRSPQFDLAEGKDLHVPHPLNSRQDMQEQEIRDLEVDPKLYYPEGYHPKLLTEWPVEGDLRVPSVKLPPKLKQKMGAAARARDELRKANGLEP